MKVAILTLHRVYNYGSVLQAYATQRIFENARYEAYIVDYITPQRTLKRKLKTDRATSFREFIHNCVRPFSVLLKEITFGGFVAKHLNLTKKCVTAEDLKKLPKFDMYVTGSDQTWNSKYNEGIDRGFFLDFTDSENKYSFVASFGKDKLDAFEINPTREYLKKYKALSVRERQGVDILKGLGFEKAVALIDPTLQIEKEEWLKLASKRLIKGKYLVLMLLYSEDNFASEYARKIADEKGLKLVKVCWDLRKPPMVDILMTHRSPEDFLSLFYYADFVVTNSFHGLAFSINLNKQFLIVPRNEFNSRIENLLQITGLENRMVSSDEEVDKEMNITINYSDVNAKLEKERCKAQDFVHTYCKGE